jgi:uncharacterized CHY-type Zn-finger protein
MSTEGTNNVSQLSLGGHLIYGIELDTATRCVHWRSDRDILAIWAPCCETYYSYLACHAAAADHPLERIPESAFDTPGALCGK